MKHVLRPYQREAVDATWRYLGEEDGNPIIVVPTGGGKSLIIGTFIKEALEQYPETRILILQHVKELIAQNYAELINFWPDAPAGIYSAGLGKRDIKARILFAGIQSIYKKAFNLQTIDLVLIDEAHLVPRNSTTRYRTFLGDLKQINPHIRLAGFTATHYRSDSGLLHRGPDALFTDIAYECNVAQLMADGYLAPLTGKSDVTQINTQGVGVANGEFIARQLEGKATDPATVKAICAEIVEHGYDRQGWLVFSCGVQSGEMLRDGLHCHGISAETIFGDTPSSERDSIIARFKRREIRALVSMGVLTTGFNARHVDLIALARPTKSTGLYVQMLGRGTRLCEGKTDCRVLDFGGNIARHGPFDAPVVKDDKKRGRGPEKPEPRDLYKPCVNLACEAMSPTSARECAECGAQFPDVERFVDTEAADLPVMSAPADRSVQWVGVTSVRYSRWEKPGKLPTLRVIYNAGLLEYSEWIALQSKRGERWMRERFPSGAGAMTIDSAIELSARFLCPAEIAIRPNGKYHDVVGYKFKTAEIIPIRKNAA